MIADYLLEELLNIGVGVAKSKTNEKINEHKLKKILKIIFFPRRNILIYVQLTKNLILKDYLTMFQII